MKKRWYQRKTNITAMLAIATAVGAALTGEMQIATMIQTIVASLIVIFMRQGIEKAGRGE